MLTPDFTADVEAFNAKCKDFTHTGTRAHHLTVLQSPRSPRCQWHLRHAHNPKAAPLAEAAMLEAGPREMAKGLQAASGRGEGLPRAARHLRAEDLTVPHPEGRPLNRAVGTVDGVLP